MINARRVGTGLSVGAAVIGILYVDILTGTVWATCTMIAILLAQALREAYALLRGAGVATNSRVAIGAAFALLLLRAAADPLGLSPGEARTILFAGLGCAMTAPLMLAIARGPARSTSATAAADEVVGAEIDSAAELTSATTGGPPRGPTPADLIRAGATALPLAWVALLGAFLLELRLIPGTAAHDIPLGLGLCFIVIASVKLGDSAAYFVGKTLGRHPMCWVSPKKTWEGSLASIVGAIAVAVLLGDVLGLDDRLMAGLGLVSNLAGQGGDLVESYFKRAVSAKDSTTTFGEMGGILDMLDALLFAAPAGYIWCELLIVRAMPL